LANAFRRFASQPSTCAADWHDARVGGGEFATARSGVDMASNSEGTGNTESKDPGRGRETTRSGARTTARDEQKQHGRKHAVESTSGDPNAGGDATADAPVVDRMTDAFDSAAQYLRDQPPSKIAGDVMRTAQRYPIPAMLIGTGLALGAGFFIAQLFRENSRLNGSARATGSESDRNERRSTTVTTIARMREAAISLALTKAVERIEERFPGFREHFEKA
jgi:hypothetical protein